MLVQGTPGFRSILALEPDTVKLDISLVRFIDRDPVRRSPKLWNMPM